MAEPVRAMRPHSANIRPLNPDHGDLWDAWAHTNDKIDGLVAVIGKPGAPDGGQPASGIFAHLSAHDTRLKKFERLWERGIGFGLCAVPMVTAIWWLAGDKLARLFHG